MHNFLKTLSIICRIERDNISYRDLIEFLYGETPPENHNFLHNNYATYIEDIIKFGPGKKNPQLFSVIIPTYNRCDTLVFTLDALLNQSGVRSDKYEIIIIDDGSTDETKTVIEKYIKHRQQTEIIYIKLKKNYGCYRARNIGIIYSRGKFLAFTDDDCIAPPRWLAVFRASFEKNPEITGIGGWKKPKGIDKKEAPMLTIYDRYHFLRMLPYRTKRWKSANIHPCNGCGDTANVCYRRKALTDAGGFNDYLRYYANWELKVRLHKNGHVLLYEPEMIEHDSRLTLAEYIKRWILVGWGDFLIHKIHPNVPTICHFSLLDMKKGFFEGVSRQLLFQKDLPAQYGHSLSSTKIISLEAIRNFCLWFGKYWIPLSRNTPLQGAFHISDAGVNT